MSGTETTHHDWVATIRPGRWLTEWTVERSPSYWDDPLNGLPSRGDVIRGWAFSSQAAEMKAVHVIWRKRRAAAAVDAHHAGTYRITAPVDTSR